MAAQALGKTRSDGAIRALMLLIDDADSEVRFRAAEGIKMHGHPKLILPLIDRLKVEENARVAGQIGGALFRLTGEGYAHNYDKWHNWALLNEDKLGN